MKKRKRVIYILILSIALYCILNYLYKNIILNDRLTTIYVLNQEIKRGEKFDIAKYDSISINMDLLNDNIKYILKEDLDKFNEMVYSDYYKQGQILYDTMLLNKEEYIKSSEQKEVIAIKVEEASDNVANQILKGNNINLYYTGNSIQSSDILNKNEKVSVKSSGINDSYTSVLFMENVKVLDVYDKLGNKIQNKKVSNNENNLIDTILIETDKENIVKINNLKKYGSFSVSILN